MFRVLHVLDNSLPPQSGYAVRTRAMMTAQAAAGLEVRAVTRSSITAGPAALREWREIGLLTDAIGDLVERWRPDVLHAHSPALCGMAALRAARRHDLPLVYEIRAFAEDAGADGREGSFRYRLVRGLENRVVAGADAVMTICHGQRDELIERGFAGGRIGTMPDGVDCASFAAPHARDEALAHDLRLGAGDVTGPVIGFIGRFEDHEGLDDLIDAMPAIVAEHPTARLLLAGDGPVTDALKRRARASRAARAIRFAGPVPQAEIERYYSLCDVMVFPRKPCRLTDLVTPRAPLEAQAHGKLVAASAVGGHRELIAEGETGTLFAPGDPADCARALADLLRRRGDWPALRDAAQARLAARHDWSRNVGRYRDLYQALVGFRARRQLPAAA